MRTEQILIVDMPLPHVDRLINIVNADPGSIAISFLIEVNVINLAQGIVNRQFCLLTVKKPKKLSEIDGGE